MNAVKTLHTPCTVSLEVNGSNMTGSFPKWISMRTLLFFFCLSDIYAKTLEYGDCSGKDCLQFLQQEPYSEGTDGLCHPAVTI